MGANQILTQRRRGAKEQRMTGISATLPLRHLCVKTKTGKVVG
jgi:hypothetical protein